MTTVKKVTEVIKLVNAVLLGVSIGLGVLRSIRETLNALAAEHQAAAKTAKAAN